MLMFVVCWSISAFRTIVSIYDLMDVPWDVTNASRLLLVANSAINPIIYSLWKKDLKTEIKKLLKFNSQLVRPSSATFRSSHDMSRYDSQSSMTGENSMTLEQRRSRANSTQEHVPTPAKAGEKKTAKKKEKKLDNGVVNDGLTSVESVEIKTVEDKATSTRPGEPMTLGIDNLVAQVDGMV